MKTTLKIFGFVLVVVAFYSYVGSTVPQKITYPPESADLSEDMTADELAICRNVYTAQLASFNEEPTRATEYLGLGESKRESTLSEPEHAALTVLANLILNLDETLTRS